VRRRFWHEATGQYHRMDDPDESQAEKLREEQVLVARRERHAAEDAPTEEDARAPDRRAEKATYLASKLAKREQSEQE
jgi:hypothetical protein